MKIFNEESESNKTIEIILVLKRKEAVNLIEALTEACKNRPRKVSWKKVLEDLTTKAGVY